MAFRLAYVLLPFAQANPVEAIRGSLAPFQDGGRGDLPDDLLVFEDETESLRDLHEAGCRFVLEPDRGCRLEMAPWQFDERILDFDRIKAEMCRQDVERWDVRFADTMDLATFFDRFGTWIAYDPGTGRYGSWLNPLRRWTYWTVGEHFDSGSCRVPGW